MSRNLRWLVHNGEQHAVPPGHDIALCGQMHGWLKPLHGWKYRQCEACTTAAQRTPVMAGAR